MILLLPTAAILERPPAAILERPPAAILDTLMSSQEETGKL